MFLNSSKLIHRLEISGEQSLPKQFTFPFNYIPHPLCVQAAREVQLYLEKQITIPHNFGLKKAQPDAIGKMFGIMIIKDTKGRLGYLAAFSGKLGESSYVDGFVPPVFDTLNPHGFYKQGEQKLNAINAQITRLEQGAAYLKAKEQLELQTANQKIILTDFKLSAKKAKAKRKLLRETSQVNLSKSDYVDLMKRLEDESKQDHFKLKDLKRNQKEELERLTLEFKRYKQPIGDLKEQRQKLSASLQRKLHESYQFINARGESKHLLDIFNTIVPPAGAGECSAPKLFQYAYKHNLQPIAMAEFWWGKSPSSQIRKHKQFYPSCRGKCEPILGFMMQGLEVAPNPMKIESFEHKTIETVYEDAHLLVINKPHDFLSVPGKSIKDSVQTRIQEINPEALLVHRLDFSTSGLLVVAKSLSIYKNLQEQFTKRTVKKCYVALLDGEVNKSSGYVDLPLRVDLDNRPQQLVCYEHGKSARTQFEVIGVENAKTRIHLYPVTGRTHQLRMHASHPQGLNCAIIGDDLYGTKADRLYLHAEQLCFEHPVTGKKLKVISQVPF